MKAILFFLLIFSFSISFSQINLETEDQKHDQIILIGQIDRSGLEMDNYKDWFNSEYDLYKVDSSSVALISKKKLKKIKIVVFMATWCGDSHEQVPRFYKIIDELKAEIEIKIYALDEHMSCSDIDVASYKIERVPTFIFYKKDKEIGRIVETPTVSLEKDLLQILP